MLQYQEPIQIAMDQLCGELVHRWTKENCNVFFVEETLTKHAKRKN